MGYKEILIKFKPFSDRYGKESACNSGDPGLISGVGRFPGEGIEYPLQYSWGSLVAQMVKNPPAMWESWVRSLGQEDPLKEEMATLSSSLAWRIPWTEEPGVGYSPWGRKESGITEHSSTHIHTNTETHTFS